MLGKNLIRLMRDKNIGNKELAKAIGCSEVSVYYWRHDRRDPKEFLIPLANYFGVSPEELNKDSEITDFRSVKVFSSASERPDGIVSIPEYRMQFACGSDNAEPTWEEVHESEPVWYRQSYFQDKGINPSKCKRGRASGSSMSPTINDGDCVLFEELNQDARIKENAIYVLAYNGDLRIKRLIKRFDGSIIIRSDNKEYPDETVEPDDQNNLQIIGRVIEVTRSLA